MTYWLKMLGSGSHAMDESLVPRVLREIRSPKRPGFNAGDRLVLYALGHDRVFAIVAALGSPYPGDGPNPWDRWMADVRKVMATSYARAPRLRDICVPGGRDLHQSIRQHAHIRLTDEEYERAVAALRRAGAEEDPLYRA